MENEAWRMEHGEWRGKNKEWRGKRKREVWQVFLPCLIIFLGMKEKGRDTHEDITAQY